jgi:hypothetical protein
MEKFWRTMTHTDLVLGTETLPRKRDITEKELNFKARCSTYLTMTVDTLCAADVLKQKGFSRQRFL